jgi:hypothetical protein
VTCQPVPSTTYCGSENTPDTEKDRRRTKQFRACDITFYDKNHTIIPNTAPLATLYTAAKAAMRITNQKNGTRGSIISHDISLTKACPIRALARRVHTIINHPQCTAGDLISTYYSSHSKWPRPLQACDKNTMIKSAVRVLHLDKKDSPQKPSAAIPYGRAGQWPCT